ncbi:NADH:flavin oxidoreductase [Porticoccaceae bacterium]|nr:NADH:flavin oxidoreductase [Porticoccaceae bacterium]
MTDLLSPLTFSRGREMKNRFILAPLTNCQSHDNGVLSDEEFNWLTMRAKGGFGLIMTCAAYVQPEGKGFPGQLGVSGDEHLEGLTRLARAIKTEDSIAVVQLQHSGMRSPVDLIGTQPHCPSDDEETGARGLSLEEVYKLRDDFIAAAVRCERAGFDGVEIHGAHGYILTQFFSEGTNHRDDQYGGSLENRYRLLDEIIEGVRLQCRSDFTLGVRLSPERCDFNLLDVTAVAERLMTSGDIDFLDMSLWDIFKQPDDPAFQGRSLMSYFTDLERGECRLGVAGMIRTPEDAETALAAGADWIILGRAAILNHNFPAQYADNPRFEPVQFPASRAHFANEGVSAKFVDYINSAWPDYFSD